MTCSPDQLAPADASIVSISSLLFPNQPPTQSYGLDVASTGRIPLGLHQPSYPDDRTGRFFWVSFGSRAMRIRSVRFPAARSVSVDARSVRVYVVDATQPQIEVFSTSAACPLFHFGLPGTAPGELRGPRQLTMDAPTHLWVS